MIRIAATICYLLTLFCPIFCLAEADGDCSDHSQERNCEAMSVGAVLVESETVANPTFHQQPAFDFLFPVQVLVAGSRAGSQLATLNGVNTKSPPSAKRQALLQTFLF
jgi:hypothetical protein